MARPPSWAFVRVVPTGRLALPRGLKVRRAVADRAIRLDRSTRDDPGCASAQADQPVGEGLAIVCDYGQRAPRPSKLDPFKPYLKMRIAEAAPRRLPATVYLRELRERGYQGGISMLKDWLAAQHPVLPAPPIARFETPPGRQAQAD